MTTPEQSEVQQIVCEGYEFSFQCPNNFWNLDATGVESVRYCNECQRKVFLCASPGDVARHQSTGHCIAVSRKAEGKPNRVTMGVVEVVPDVSDSLVDSHKSFTTEIDKQLTNELRREGFNGPRSQLVRESDSFIETVNIVTSAAKSQCRISLSFSFAELRGMQPFFAVSTYWETFGYENSDLVMTAQTGADAFRSSRRESKRELERVHSVLSNLETDRLPRPLSTNPKIEKHLSDHHMAWLFNARENVKLADVLSRRSLDKLTALCNRMLRHLERDVIYEHEFVAKVLHGYDEENLGYLIWGWDGQRILRLDEVFAAFSPEAKAILGNHEPFLAMDPATNSPNAE